MTLHNVSSAGDAFLQIDEAEMIVRMISSIAGMARPPGNATELLEQLDSELVDQCRRAALAAILYVTEQAGCVEFVVSN